MKKIVVFLLVMILFVCFVPVSFAQGNEAERGVPIQIKYVALTSANANLEITGKKATCAAVARISSTSYSVQLQMTLQQRSASGWKNLESWSTTGTGSRNITLTKTRKNLASGTYRVYVYVAVYDRSGKFIESTTAYSASKKI